MARVFKCKFLSANLQGDGSYILDAANDETPDNFDWETGDSDNAIATPGGTWPTGEPILDHTGGASILSSTDTGIPTAVPSAGCRILVTFEVDADPNFDYTFLRFYEDNNNDLDLEWDDSGPALRVRRANNAGSGLNEWVSGTISAGTAYAVEIRLDASEGDDDDMLQCRLWEVDNYASESLTSGTEAGTGDSTPNNFDTIVSSEGSGNFTKIGRIIVDSNPNEDLSGDDTAYTDESGGGDITVYNLAGSGGLVGSGNSFIVGNGGVVG